MGGICVKLHPRKSAFDEQPSRSLRERFADFCACRHRETTIKTNIIDTQLEGVDIIQYEQELTTLLQASKNITVVFIFGGPGSKKGAFVENLLQTFNFHLVSAEELIKRYLPEKIEERARRDGLVFSARSSLTSGRTTEEILTEGSKEMTSGDHVNTLPPTWYSKASADNIAMKLKLMLQDYPGELTLMWVMTHVVEEISRSAANGESYFLVDMLPNFDFMYVHSFNLLDCSREMKWFESQFSSLLVFAILLKVTDEEIDEMFVPSSDYISNHVKGDVKSEIDITLIKKRKLVFLKALRPYFEYFRETGRLVTVYPARAPFELMWLKLRDLLIDLGLHVRSVPDIVILFTGTNEEKKLTEKTLTWKKKKIRRLSTLEALENEFKNYFEGRFQQKIIVCDMKLYHQMPKPKQLKQIIFVEEGEQMTHFTLYDFNEYPQASPKSDDERNFRIISSPNNVVCFFPMKVDEKLCRQMVGQVMLLLRKQCV